MLLLQVEKRRANSSGRFHLFRAGNWTSWPPHEHAKMLEEMYVYFDMPSPGFGIQLVYNNTDYPELITADAMATQC